MATGKKRLLTGLQPSGQLHIGNYFGALKPFIDRHSEFESMLMVADYHALTSLKNPAELKKNTLDVVLDYLGAGLDPKEAVIFRQSEVSQHTELAWIFESLVTVQFLTLSHAYKDKVAKGMEPNAGLLNYPMLMAADILLYDTDFVPVGKDQTQHIEYTREAAAKFNNTFGEVFKDPKGIFLEEVATVPGTDGQKMSKSYGNTIPLFGTKDEITKSVMSIVTDSSGERPANVYSIHRLLKSEAEIAPLYEEKKGKYKDLKEAFIEDLESFIAPMRERRERYASDRPAVDAILKEGNDKARTQAEAKMKVVRSKIGLTI
jgi:tryptophanyl-tRNA synthetase